MRRLHRTASLLASALLIGACGKDIVVIDPFDDVDEIDGLTLEVAVPTAMLAIGDTVVATMTLRNASGTAKRLEFGSSCQIMPYIATAAGDIQHPGGGSWACAAVLTHLEVPAHGAVVRSIVLRGTASPTSMSPMFSMPAGHYRLHATLDPFSDRGRLRSADVAFEVR